MSKKKTTPVPPTVLVITLEPDGNGSLLTRRGDLARLSQFTYRGLQEIVAAIQAGAAQLVELEANPPTVENVPGESPSTPTAEVPPETETSSTPNEATAADRMPNESAAEADVQAMPAAQPDNSLFASNAQQAKLF